MLLQKNLSLSSVDLKVDTKSGKFSGYASVFGGVDASGDTIVKGAFASTLKNNGMPKMFYNHKWDMPIGKWLEATEDDHGLFVRGELTPGLALAADVRAAMLHGTLDGLSVGGLVKAEDSEETSKGRIYRNWTRLLEVSPVVFPADDNARITSAKSIDWEALLPECRSERELERLLRDAGLGKWESMALISRAKSIFQGRDASADDEANKAMADAVAARINRMAESRP